MKKKTIFIIIAVVVLLIILATVLCVGVLNSPKFKMQKAEKLLAKEDYREAMLIYRDMCYEEPENIDAHIGYIKAEIGRGERDVARDAVGGMLDAISQYELTYPKEEVEELVMWLILGTVIGEDCDADDFDDTINELALIIPDIIQSGEWSEFRYEEVAPYKEYRVYILNGVEIEIIYYSGRYATVEWKIEGYEDVEPFKEYQVKYINGVATEEKQYTGKVKPKEPPKPTYSYPECPYCGYSAALSPDNHPGHGLEGMAAFKRGQNADGSWGFYVKWE